MGLPLQFGIVFVSFHPLFHIANIFNIFLCVCTSTISILLISRSILLGYVVAVRSIVINYYHFIVQMALSNNVQHSTTPQICYGFFIWIFIESFLFHILPGWCISITKKSKWVLVSKENTNFTVCSHVTYNMCTHTTFSDEAKRRRGKENRMDGKKGTFH